MSCFLCICTPLPGGWLLCLSFYSLHFHQKQNLARASATRCLCDTGFATRNVLAEVSSIRNIDIQNITHLPKSPTNPLFNHQVSIMLTDNIVFAKYQHQKTQTPHWTSSDKRESQFSTVIHHDQPLTTISSIQCIFTITKYHISLAKLYIDVTDSMCPWHRPIDSPLASMFIILCLDEWVQQRRWIHYMSYRSLLYLKYKNINLLAW